MAKNKKKKKVPQRHGVLVDSFTELNKRHFSGQLEVPTCLRFDKVEKPEDDGHGHYVDAANSLTVSLEARAFGPLFYRDALLHEMIHQAVAKLDGHPAKDHDTHFVARANSIADALDLKHVEADSRSAKQWPKTLRSEDYYGAAESQARQQVKWRNPRSSTAKSAPSGALRSNAPGAHGRTSGGGHGDR